MAPISTGIAGDGDSVTQHTTWPVRVVVTGSESVGKTTLSEQLAAHYGAPRVPEFVRGFAERKGAPLVFLDHEAITFGQAAMADACLEQARRDGATLLVHDTDLVSTAVYHWHYYGKCPAYIEDAARARLADHYLLLDIDVPWVPDGVRDRGDRREEVQSLFAATLQRYGAEVTIIRGTWEVRWQHALHTVDHLLAAARSPDP